MTYCVKTQYTLLYKMHKKRSLSTEPLKGRSATSTVKHQ